jgi:hypothetical protein
VARDRRELNPQQEMLQNMELVIRKRFKNQIKMYQYSRNNNTVDEFYERVEVVLRPQNHSCEDRLQESSIYVQKTPKEILFLNSNEEVDKKV